MYAKSFCVILIIVSIIILLNSHIFMSNVCKSKLMSCRYMSQSCISCVCTDNIEVEKYSFLAGVPVYLAPLTACPSEGKPTAVSLSPRGQAVP